MATPKRVRECYFYKDKGKYYIKLVDSKNNYIKESIICDSRVEVNSFIQNLREGKLKKYCCSALGTKIYNRVPTDRNLAKESKSVYHAFVTNLQTISESSTDSAYKMSVAGILRNLANIMDLDTLKDPMDDYSNPMDMECDHLEGPLPAVAPEVPEDLISMIEESLSITIDRDNLTFWFQNQKFQLTKSVYDSEVPSPDSPGTSNAITSALEYMITLLGVNADRNKEVGENSFTFALEQEVYKIKHIYTGSGISVDRGDE